MTCPHTHTPQNNNMQKNMRSCGTVIRKNDQQQRSASSPPLSHQNASATLLDSKWRSNDNASANVFTPIEKIESTTRRHTPGKNLSYIQQYSTVSIAMISRLSSNRENDLRYIRRSRPHRDTSRARRRGKSGDKKQPHGQKWFMRPTNNRHARVAKKQTKTRHSTVV